MKRVEEATKRNISLSYLLREIGVSSGVFVLAYLSPYNYLFLSILLVTSVFSLLSTPVSEEVEPDQELHEDESVQEEVEVGSDLSRIYERRQIMSSDDEDSAISDESFIEITFPHGHSFDPQESQPLMLESKKTTGSGSEILSLEILFRKYGFLELLSEINDEDNWIDINFKMDSPSSIMCHG